VCVCLPLVSTLKHKNRYGRWRRRGCCTSQQSRTPGGVSPIDRTWPGQKSSRKTGGNLQNRYCVKTVWLIFTQVSNIWLLCLGKLVHSELDDRALDALKEFPVDGAQSVLQQFLESNLEHVSNKSAFLCGIMKTYRSVGS